MKVEQVMSRDVSVVNTQDSIDEAAKRMKDLNVGSVPVCDENNSPIGIVTDRDVAIRAVSNGYSSSENVEQIMTSEVISVHPEDDIHKAARIMGENQVRRLPVVENGKIVGIVSIGDLAVRNIYIDDAGKALSEISTPSKPMF